MADVNLAGKAVEQVTEEFKRKFGAMPEDMERTLMFTLGKIASYIDRPADEKDALGAAAVLLLSHSYFMEGQMPPGLKDYGPVVEGIVEDFAAMAKEGKQYTATRDLMQLGLVHLLVNQDLFFMNVQQMSQVIPVTHEIVATNPEWPEKFNTGVDDFVQQIRDFKGCMTGEQPRLEKAANETIGMLCNAANEIKKSVHFQVTIAPQLHDDKFKLN